MSKHFSTFLEGVDAGLGGTGLVLLRLKRGRRILVIAPFTKRGSPNLKAQKHILSLGVKKGVFF